MFWTIWNYIAFPTLWMLPTKDEPGKPEIHPSLSDKDVKASLNSKLTEQE